MPSSLVVDQLIRLRELHPETPIVAFVPREQLGRALETALARHKQGWEGLRTTTPRRYAESIAAMDRLQSGREEAPVEGRLFWTARILQSLSGREGDEDGPRWHRLADTVSRAVDTLRKEAVEPSELRARADASDAAETLGLVADCYDRYVDGLDSRGRYDDGHVYRWATERVRDGRAPGVSESVYAVCGAATVPEHAVQFLSALRSRARAFMRLGLEAGEEPPPDTVAARFGAVPSPGANLSGESSSADADLRFVRAVGAAQEVKAVFRDLLRADVPFGDAVIAYTDATPYASLLADEAERVGIPLTMGTGLPADQSRTGRALRGLFEWVREDYDPSVLIRMLREGLLRTDRWLARRDPAEAPTAPDGETISLRPHEAATLLAERSYEPGREGLIGGLRGALRSLTDELGARPEGARDWEKARLQRLDRLVDYVEALASLMPDGRADVREVASSCCHFLEVFGPVDAPTAEEGERTLDEAARALLYQRLERLTTIPEACTAPDRQLATLLQRWLEGQYVQAESPRPGHVHVLPLESAGYGDRPHLSVVGLDSTTFAAPAPENGMLQESDRQVLLASRDAESRVPTQADAVLWQAERALRRHRGAIAFYSRSFDVESGEERDPSALFLQYEQAAQTESDEPTGTVVGLVPANDGPPLGDDEQWLRAYREARTSGDGRAPETTARDRIREVYPWILHGEAARRARRSDRYTEHDGLLPEGTYPELQLFDGREKPLSASRLETLAEAPYIYFLKYVLGVQPLDEPALDDEPWLNRLRKGTLLHRIYEVYVRELDGRSPTADGAPDLDEVVDRILDDEAEAFAPPSRVIRDAARRELRRNAQIFLRAEIERAEQFRPVALEWGFGMPRHRREEGDRSEPARLSLGDHTFPFRGRIDRVECNRETGGLQTWDYKTGGRSGYDPEAPLQDGKTLQWALYAYAWEALNDEEVEESGYFFANTKEMGARVSADPGDHRAAVASLLDRLTAMAASGSFPLSPALPDVNDWAWRGYDRLVGDLRDRQRELRNKTYPDDRPEPPSF